MVVLLGVVLIFIGFVLVVARRGLLPGTSSEGDPLGDTQPRRVPELVSRCHITAPSGIAPDTQSRRRKLVEMLIGVGLMVLGGLCIVFGWR